MVPIVKYGVAEKILSATLINVNAGFAQALGCASEAGASSTFIQTEPSETLFEACPFV